MGIEGILPRVLDSAGREIKIKDLTPSNGKIIVGGGRRNKKRKQKRRRRYLRIGIDISQWIHNATHAISDELGDDRHFYNSGRAELSKEKGKEGDEDEAVSNKKYMMMDTRERNYIDKCTKIVLDKLDKLKNHSPKQSEILVVLDGQTPPLKKETCLQRFQQRKKHQTDRDKDLIDEHESPTKDIAARIKGNKRGGATNKQFTTIITQLQDSFRRIQQPFLVAPFEADSQLAYLSQHGYIDLIITEDSDLIAYGCRSILYKTDPNVGTGKLLQFDHIGSSRGGGYCRSRDRNPNGDSFNLTDFTPVMMAVYYVCAGNDYIKNLHGIGLVKACDIVREAFLHNHQNEPPLELVLDKLFERCSESEANKNCFVFQNEYEQRFLSAVIMYRHSIVYNPIEQRCILTGFESRVEEGERIVAAAGEGDFQLLQYKPYELLCQNIERISKIVGEIPKGINHTDIAEGRINLRRGSQYQPNNNNNNNDSGQQTSNKDDDSNNNSNNNRTAATEHQELGDGMNNERGVSSSRGQNDNDDNDETNEMIFETQPKESKMIQPSPSTALRLREKQQHDTDDAGSKEQRHENDDYDDKRNNNNNRNNNSHSKNDDVDDESSSTPQSRNLLLSSSSSTIASPNQKKQRGRGLFEAASAAPPTINSKSGERTTTADATPTANSQQQSTSSLSSATKLSPNLLCSSSTIAYHDSSTAAE